MINYEGLYRRETYEKAFSANPLFDKELHFRVIENGTILPHKFLNMEKTKNWGVGGIVDAEGKFVKESFVVTNRGEAYIPESEIPHFDTTVIYLTMYFPVWGHIITDEIKHVWFLKTDAYKKYFSSCPIVINPWDTNTRGGRGDNTPIHRASKNFGD